MSDNPWSPDPSQPADPNAAPPPQYQPPSGQYAPPSQYPQPPYGQPPYPQYPQYPQPPYGQPPSGQYAPPSGQYAPPPQYPPYAPPQPPYGQAPYSQPLYGQPGYYAPPSMQPPAAARNRSTLALLAVAVVVIAGITLLVTHPFIGSPPSVTGTWYGTGTITRNGSTQDWAVYLDLTQNGSTFTGSVEGCGPDFTSSPFKVDGSISGSTITLHETNSSSSDTFLTGQISDDRLALSYSSQDQNEFDSVSLQRGSHDDYVSACKRMQPN